MLCRGSGRAVCLGWRCRVGKGRRGVMRMPLGGIWRVLRRLRWCWCSIPGVLSSADLRASGDAL